MIIPFSEGKPCVLTLQAISHSTIECKNIAITTNETIEEWVTVKKNETTCVCSGETAPTGSGISGIKFSGKKGLSLSHNAIFCFRSVRISSI